MIRALTVADADILEELIDSRKTFQGLPTDHAGLKANHLRRLSLPNCIYFGNFQDSKLVAVITFHLTDRLGHAGMGAAWTVPGLPRWPGSKRPAPLIELIEYALDTLHEHYVTDLWVIAPANPAWESTVDVPGIKLTDPTKYERTDIGVIDADSISGDDFIDRWVLGKHFLLPQKQKIIRYTDLNPKALPDLSVPEDAPPRDITGNPDTWVPAKGTIPTPHEPPPRG